MESKRQQRVEKRQTMMEASFLALLIDSRSHQLHQPERVEGENFEALRSRISKRPLAPLPSSWRWSRKSAAPLTRSNIFRAS